MHVKITSVYENEGNLQKNLKGSDGNAFLLEFENEKLLFDVGIKGKILLHNMGILEISPDSITKIVFSHGHLDHTWALPKLLENVSDSHRIHVYGAENLREVKKLKLLGLRTINVGFPKLKARLEEKIEYHLSFDPIIINPFIKTTGRISSRPEKYGIVGKIVHFSEEQWKSDEIEDDLSLIVQSKNGLVIIGGCMHSGLLNTCSHVSKMFPGSKISTVIGGTHMVGFSQEEIDYVSEQLREKYQIEKLYLNHCTGKKAIDRLRTNLGSDIVSSFHVGSTLEFEC